jgi:hypothetical protein
MEHVAIVSHDAGGAEILSSWLKRTNCLASVVVAGPAEKIFRRKCPQANFMKLDEALIKSSWVLSGTGWQSNFELQAISKARNLGIKTVAFLDHWVNYRERFEENGYIVLPDEIWVGDTEAERIASNLFDQTPVLLKLNPYFEDIVEEIEVIQQFKAKPKKTEVLYVCEPIGDKALKEHGNERHFGYHEHDALRFFLKNISALCQPIDTITIRPHPSDPEDKYQWARNVAGLPVQFGGKKTLLEETLDSTIVVGCESMAMVVGLLAKKRVISTIPPGGPPCRLPHLDIENLQQLVGSRTYHND